MNRNKIKNLQQFAGLLGLILIGYSIFSTLRYGGKFFPWWYIVLFGFQSLLIFVSSWFFFRKKNEKGVGLFYVWIFFYIAQIFVHVYWIEFHPESFYGYFGISSSVSFWGRFITILFGWEGIRLFMTNCPLFCILLTGLGLGARLFILTSFSFSLGASDDYRYKKKLLAVSRKKMNLPFFPSRKLLSDLYEQQDCSKDHKLELKIRNNLSVWGNNIPEHSYHNLGDLIQIKSIMEYPLYQFSSTYQMEYRQLEHGQRPYRQEQESSVSFSAQKHDLWQEKANSAAKYLEFKQAEFEFDLPVSFKRVSCGKCQGTGSTECGMCRGSGDCHHCHGKGEVKCLRCSASGNCITCDGTGDTINDTSCYSCGGSGNCSFCKGKGEVRCDDCWGSGKCRHCTGTGKVSCSLCMGQKYLLDYYFFLQRFVPEKRQISFAGDFLKGYPEVLKAAEEKTSETFFLAQAPDLMKRIIQKDKEFNFEDIQGPVLKELLKEQIEKGATEFASSTEGTRVQLCHNERLQVDKCRIYVVSYTYENREYLIFALGQELEIIPISSPIQEEIRQSMSSIQKDVAEKKYSEAYGKVRLFKYQEQVLGGLDYERESFNKLLSIIQTRITLWTSLPSILAGLIGVVLILVSGLYREKSMFKLFSTFLLPWLGLASGQFFRNILEEKVKSNWKKGLPGFVLAVSLILVVLKIFS